METIIENVKILTGNLIHAYRNVLNPGTCSDLQAYLLHSGLSGLPDQSVFQVCQDGAFELGQGLRTANHRQLISALPLRPVGGSVGAWRAAGGPVDGPVDRRTGGPSRRSGAGTWQSGARRLSPRELIGSERRRPARALPSPRPLPLQRARRTVSYTGQPGAGDIDRAI